MHGSLPLAQAAEAHRMMERGEIFGKTGTQSLDSKPFAAGRAMMRLLYAPTSPYVRKVMVSAHLLGLTESIELLASAAHPIDRDARIAAHNPRGQGTDANPRGRPGAVRQPGDLRVP